MARVKLSKIFNILQEGVFKRKSDVVVAFGIIVIVMMLIIPLPTPLLDFLQSLNLAFSLMIILITLYVKHALEFSIFPTVLLNATVLSLALNVSSTRLILWKGPEFDGRIIKSFSTFVVGTAGPEGLVIGIIVFIIIIAVQFIVITKGATRVSEVAARFTLDALPGKQMAIDQEYSSGLLTEEEAQRKKKELQREVDFYGSMDGASKFVSGNVVVGILITVINIIGGIITGMIFRGEDILGALSTYTSLTIGDGLVSQFPALFISTATGIIVTRSISEDTFGKDVKEQFSKQSIIYWIVGVVLIVLGILPGFPWYILFPMGILSFLFAYFLGVNEQKRISAEIHAKEERVDEKNVEISPIAPLDPISLELGYGLISLVDQESGAELLDRITKIRKDIALELGLVIPRVRIVDNMALEPSEYSIKIRGSEVGSYVMRMSEYLCINPSGVNSGINGEKTFDPAFSLPAMWISENNREKAERMGLTVVDPPSVIATHLTEVIKRNASELLGRKETKSILEELRKEYSALVDDVQNVLSLGEVQKILQLLLQEQVSIRNIVGIFEKVADFAPITKDVYFLAEKARQALKRELCLDYKDQNNKLSVCTIEGELERFIIESKVDTSYGPVLAMPPEIQRIWVTAAVQASKDIQEMGFYPVFLTQEASRYIIKNSLKRELSNLVVLSIQEIVDDVSLEVIKEIKIDMSSFAKEDREEEFSEFI